MGNILSQIKAIATAEIEAGGFHWKIQKVGTSDLARVGHASLMVAQAFKGSELSDTPTGDEKSQQNATEGGFSGIDSELIQSVSAETLQNMADLKNAVVMAGTLAAGDGKDWEDIKIVELKKDEDGEKGRIWIGSLPPGVDDVLFNEIMSISTDQGAAISRLAAFRGQAGSASIARSSRSKVRKGAARASKT